MQYLIRIPIARLRCHYRHIERLPNVDAVNNRALYFATIHLVGVKVQKLELITRMVRSINGDLTG